MHKKLSHQKHQSQNKEQNLIFSLKSLAKINRFMRIIERTPEGMHKLQTLFQFIDLADDLHFYKINPTNNSLNTKSKVSTNLDFIDGTKNIVLKAAELLQEEYKLNLKSQEYKNVTGACENKANFIYDKFDIYIHIEKKIPTGGGLGGGSSNAATTLLALNHIWQMNFTKKQLALMGLKLGADVPIFIHSKSAYAQGVGEILTDAPNIDTPLLILIYPGLGSNSGEVFQSENLKRKNTPIEFNPNKSKIPKLNDATSLVREKNPAVNAAWIWLEAQGLEPQLTGTGACIFAQVKEASSATRVLKKMPKKFATFTPEGFLVKTQNSTYIENVWKNK